MTVIDRRRFIQYSLASVAACATPSVSASATAQPPTLLSACDDQQGRHWISGWTLTGKQAFRLQTPWRGHDISTSPDGHYALFFARRPGLEVAVVDTESGALIKTITSPPGRHFFGHGAFSPDGNTLFTSENNFRQGHGVIGIYATDTFQRLGEFHSGNIGPHQIELLSDGKTLVVANGGILTHPDSPREALNLDTMSSSLTYLDTRNGQLLQEYHPINPRMSIRHLAVGSDDTVVMGVQYQGDRSDILPLVLTHKGENHLQILEADELHWLGQNQYIASVAIDSLRQRAVTTSPRGHSVSVWDLADGSLLSSHTLRDVAGVVYSEALGQFILSNGLGELKLLDSTSPDSLSPLFSQRDLRWDNHLALTTTG